MPHDGRGLAEFGVARWPWLVRTARVLGAPAPVALEVAALALARLPGRWRHLDEQGDPDVEVLRLLFAAWAETCREPWWRRHRGEQTAGDLAALDTLAPRERAAAALEHLLELDPLAVHAVLGRAVAPHDVAVDAGAWAGARAAPVADPVPTTAALRSLARGRRARRTRVWAVRLGPVVLAVAVLVAVLLALTTPPPKMANDGRTALPAPLSRAPTSATQDPETWVTWYAAGRLHLGATVVRVRAVTQLVGVSGGAVYANAEGQVVLVRPTGERTRLGLTNSSSTLVASADGALVGWADIGRSDARVLTVVDGADGRSRRTLALSEDDDARPVGLLGDRMYVVRFGRTYGWQLRDAELRPVAEVPLLTVAGGQVALGPLDTSPPSVGITSIDPADRVPEGSSWLRVPGEAATLSPDGAIVLVRTTDGDVRLRDLATGRDLPSGLAASEVARAVEVGSQGRVAYVVARRAQRPETDDEASSFGSPVTVRTCTLSVDRTTMTCESVALVSGPSALPLLAR